MAGVSKHIKNHAKKLDVNTMSDYSAAYPRLPVTQTGLRGRCPRCGEGRLFNGILSLAAKCHACGLSYDFADSADGPAVFVMFIVSSLVIGAAVAVEVIWAPPVWIHALVWLPLIPILSIALLRPLKGLMVALQYVNKAEEGKLHQEQ
jgi:uncharacterized protein (DUF983 family)